MKVTRSVLICTYPTSHRQPRRPRSHSRPRPRPRPLPTSTPPPPAARSCTLSSRLRRYLLPSKYQLPSSISCFSQARPCPCILARHNSAVATNLGTLHSTMLSGGMRKRHCSPEVQFVCRCEYATVGRLSTSNSES